MTVISKIKPISGLGLLLVGVACGPLSYDGSVVNSANSALSGCEGTWGSCNGEVASGVVAKFETNDDGELTIRFMTLTDNLNDTVTYRDGARTVTMDVIGETTLAGLNSYLELEDAGLQSVALVGGAVASTENVVGFVGLHTDASVIPTEGEATYFGLAGVSTESGDYGDGLSVLEVDFGAATADLYAAITSGTLTSFNQVQSLNMEIDGYTFTGDEVVLLLNDNPVNVTGASTSGSGAGMFYGPVDLHGNPIEYGAVAIVSGNDDRVVLLSAGSIGGYLEGPM